MALATPLTLQGNLIIAEICNHKVPWDPQLSKQLVKRVGTESANRSNCAMFCGTRTAAGLRWHCLCCDMATKWNNTTLLAAKGQLAKLGLTVPRLDMVATHMAMNLVANVQNTLTHLPSPKIYAWLDSTVSNHWIFGNNQYKQFIAKRVKKIHENAEIQ